MNTRPDDWGRRALAAQQAGDYATAMDAYWQALQADPANPHLYNNFGVLLKELGEYALAETCLREALRLDSAFSRAYNNLGNVLRQLERAPEAAEAFEAALRLAPDDPEVLLNLGNARVQTLELDAAFRAYERALRLRPADADTRWNYALALLLAGRYAEAWPYYEARWDLAGAVHPFDRARRWDGGPVEGRLVLWHEQGFGDSFQFLRALPEIAARAPRGELIFAGPAGLRRVVEDSFPGVRWQAADEAAASDYAAQLPLMSAAGLLGWKLPDLPGRTPYLRAGEDAARAAADWLGPSDGRPRVGLVWGSGVWGRGRSDRDRQRKSMPLERLSPLIQNDGIQWIALQVGPARDELASGPAVRDAYGLLNDWAGTAGVVSRLDLVITVDTGVAHLAAALGRPVWLMLKHDSGNFWLVGRSDSPWYPTLRIFRQDTPGDWTGVIESVAEALTTLSIPK